MGNSSAESSLNNEKSLKRDSKDCLRSKEFVERDCLLDDLMKSEHIVTVYRLFLALLIGSALHLAAHEYSHSGEINFGQRLIIKSFAKFHRFAALWICLFLTNFLVYYGLKYWAIVRTNLISRTNVKLWDYFFLGILLVYLHGWLWICTWVAVRQEIPILLKLIMGAEITRMLMKSYAFVRSNAPRVLNYKPHTENAILYPALSQFMYFLWVPTLVYRDSYPRTKCIRWNYVATRIAEFVAGMFMMSITIEQYIIIAWRDYGKKPYSWSDFAVIFTKNAACGVVISAAGHYMVLHLWMGAFAEICTFADRLFYQDWWTSTNYARFYRTWNLVVHDWLYTYVYIDCYEIVFPKNKVAAKYAVFFLSAMFHEYILYTAFGFVLPIVFIQFFFISTVLTLFNIKPAVFGNILILYGLGLGNGTNFTAFGLEYFARVNCPIENPTIISYLVPRLFSCGVD